MEPTSLEDQKNQVSTDGKQKDDLNKIYFYAHKSHENLEIFKYNEDNYFKGEFQSLVRSESDPLTKELY